MVGKGEAGRDTYHPLGEEAEEASDEGAPPVAGTRDEGAPLDAAGGLVHFHGGRDLADLEQDEGMLLIAAGVVLGQDGLGLCGSPVGDQPARGLRKLPPLEMIHVNTRSRNAGVEMTYKEELQYRKAAL